VHDALTRRKGSHDTVMQNLQLLKLAGIRVIVKMVVLKTNAHDISSLHTYCTSNGFTFQVDASVFSKLNGDNTPHEFSLSGVELDNVIIECDRIIGYELYAGQCKLEALVCEQMRISLSINPNGDVNPCNRMPISLGNIFSDSLNNIWNNSDVLGKLSNATYNDCSECASCDVIKYCVRCPGNALVEDGCIDYCSTLSKKIAQSRARVYAI